MNMLNILKNDIKQEFMSFNYGISGVALENAFKHI